MQTGKYKAVVFDLDGTAVNSHYNIDALQMTCIELLDREATDEELKITYGMTAVNAMRYLGVPEDQLETFGNRWLEHIMRLAKHATLFDGIYPTMCQPARGRHPAGNQHLPPRRRAGRPAPLHPRAVPGAVFGHRHLRQGKQPQARPRLDALLLRADRPCARAGAVCGGQRV